MPVRLIVRHKDSPEQSPALLRETHGGSREGEAWRYTDGI